MTLTVGVLTSGGDAPGMNAAIRSVVRMAAHHGFKVLGFHRAFEGLMAGDYEALQPRSVANILQRGGTFLRSVRCDEFKTKEGLERGAKALGECGVDALVIIGGDGSFHGGHELGGVWDGQVIGVPGTIDNDIYGTDETIGFDTALNTALDAIDRIRDTASAHERLFVVEVMGRHSGFIALNVGTAGGAEDIFVPEAKTDLEGCAQRLIEAREKGKAMSIIICAEGDEQGGGFATAEKLQKMTGLEPRVTVLGHIQRGGPPTARDRILATKLGAFAVEAVQDGKTDVMVGESCGELVTRPLEETWARKKELDGFLLGLIPILAK